MIVLLDNGHGGIINGEYQTPGKRSPVWADGSQLFEGEFNRRQDGTYNGGFYTYVAHTKDVEKKMDQYFDFRKTN